MRIAEPNVQLIGHTVFTPPVDGDGELFFEPDPKNFIDDYTALGEIYDSQALVEFAGRSCYESYHRPNEKTATNAGYLSNIHSQKHFSVDEHGYATMYINGVSRSCTHELVRHRHLSPSQLSQRFVNGEEANAVIPPLLLEHMDVIVESDYEEVMEDLLERIQDVTSEAYAEIVRALEKRGVKGKPAREAARAVLPNMTETKIVLSGNYRAWMEFLIKRDSPHADAEIRGVAQQIGALLADHAPNVFGPQARRIWQPDE